ncbi:MAG: hypothetical protein WDZ51_03800 [Pirellulaceae bacterium]
MPYEELPDVLKEGIGRAANMRDPSDLSQELAFARAMLERESNNTHVSIELLKTIGKLAKEFELSMLRKKEYIPAADLQRLSMQIVDVFITHFQDFDGFEYAIDAVCAEIPLLIGPEDDR